ncbi:MAG: DUF2778 domain-containing protein [Methylovirgula sp.]
MTHGIGTPDDFMPFDRGGLSRQFLSQTVSGVLALAFCALAGALFLYARPAATPDAPAVDETLAVEPPATPAVMRPRKTPPKTPSKTVENTYIALLDPTYSLGYPPVPLAKSSPLGANFVAMTPAVPAAVVASRNVSPIPAPVPMPAVAELSENVPLPPLHRPQFAWPESHSPAPASNRVVARRHRAIRAAQSDKPGFFERLFGARQPSGQVLAYAAPEDNVLGSTRRIVSGRPSLPYDRETAVYDIAAHTVYLPDGTRLEAHSGLGSRLDDPRYVGERMRGATPPHVYELKPRESLFHGVRALRLIPIGGGGIFGRTGLLAHTYMLGPNGQSNGCVSFRNYNAFLQAYQRGEIKRLAVVARLN